MEPQIACLDLGQRVLLPGVNYTLVKEITNDIPLGTYLKFFGWNIFGRGYVLYFYTKEGEKISIALEFTNEIQSNILKNFENYLVGDNPTSKSLIENSSPEIAELLYIYKGFLLETPEDGELLFRRIREARSQAAIADDRAGAVGNSYEKAHKDFCTIYDLLMSSLEKITR